jgi:exosortase
MPRDMATRTTTFHLGAPPVSPAVRTGLFAVYSAGLMLAHLQVLRALVELSRGDSSASHLILVPFVSLALVVQARAGIFSSARFEWRRGLAVIGVGVAWTLTALWYPPLGTLSSSVAAFVVLWIGGFLLSFGAEAFRAAAFPLFFLVFMVPIPAVLLDGAVRVLTIGSSEAVATLLTLTGTPYHREGFVFWLPNLAIEVADECSGIRSTIALALTGLLAGHMYLRRGWSKALLVAVILPVTILKNAIRIVTLSLLSIHMDAGFLTGRLHQDGGVVFFLLALGLLAPVLTVLRRSEDRAAAAGAHTPTLRGHATSDARAAVGVHKSHREVPEGTL